MPRAFDGTIVPERLKALPCGGVPFFDHDSGYAYRCDKCFAVIGSIGMPRGCAKAYEEQQQKPGGVAYEQ